MSCDNCTCGSVKSVWVCEVLSNVMAVSSYSLHFSKASAVVMAREILSCMHPGECHKLAEEDLGNVVLFRIDADKITVINREIR